jgi:branched-subunit amino acid transport protein
VGETTPITALIAASAATYVWRGAGAALARRIGVGGAAFEWFSCVAYAMLAALIARLILLPGGILNETPFVDRVGATAFGLVLFFVSRRNVFVGTIGGLAAFVALAHLRAEGWL